MKNIIKGIFTIILTICSIVGIESITLFNLTYVEAYAEIREDKPCLKSIYVNQGNDIEFSKDVYSYIIDVDKEEKEIFLRAKPLYDSYVVRINGDIVDKDDKYKKNIKLNMGKNKIIIEVSNNEKFKNDDYYKSFKEEKEEQEYETQTTMNDSEVTEYVVYIYRGGTSAVYLKDIWLDDQNIGFTKGKNFYNLDIDEDDNLVEFQFSKFDDRDIILVNNNELKNINKLKVKFKGIGKYTVNIDVIDYETKRKGSYVFNIYYGIEVTPNVSDSINSVLKPNQWVIVNGRWQYNDSLGKALKAQWYYDNKYKAYFYFNGRGNMKTGWIIIKGNTYYLGNDGKMRTGWVKYENEWYYLDHNGVMRTHWVEDDGNWYYLNDDGSMKTGWFVNNGKWYYLNKDGQMEKGWILDNKKWYYLSDNGDMKTGWLKYNDEWYYLNNDGSMKSGEWIKQNNEWYYIAYSGIMRRGWLWKDEKYYYFNQDGTMRTEPLIIDNYLYEFNEDGSVNFSD
ncbi:cadherin-like beta sandwich domain-containing protein [uncultured Clostridium sp.]|uniref:cadherin-like beta sandwich domain-containing protein n=1 Tax=uncultured Clostridium sp. TaxID=59620 RepID=UPI0025E904AF|nr:cadherin-like beta sandwich domain-containing protein [uncultured Clostridium sp.]